MFQVSTFTQDEFLKHFTINVDKFLGKGLDSNVYLVRENNTNMEYALKVQASEKNTITFQKDIHFLTLLNHPNIVRGISRSEDFSCVLLELMPYGSISKYISTGFQAEIVRSVFSQVCEAISYLHYQNIVHSDIKPENTLISADGTIKICDFGFSIVVNPDHYGHVIGGSKGFIAPEIHQQYLNYDEKKCDIFSLGVFLFVLFLGSKPFEDTQPDDPKWRIILNGRWSIYWQIFTRDREIEDSFKTLIQKMIDPNPSLRYTIQQVIENEWIKGQKASKEEIKQELDKRLEKIYLKKVEKQAQQQQQCYSIKPI